MKSSHPIRIVYVNHTGKVSGAERVLIEMVRGLDRSAFEPFVICPADGELAGMLRAEGVACIESPPVQARFTSRPTQISRAIVSMTRAILALRKVLKWLAPDIVHANSLRAGITASVAAIGSGPKVIWHVHDILPRHAFSFAIRLLAFVLRPARVVAVSDATARAFRGPFLFRGRVATIHNGTDLSRFPAKRADSLRLRGEWGIPEDAFLVCAVGQICARKGLRELLNALEQTRGAAPKIHLAIAGKVVFVHEESYFESLLRAVGEPGLVGRVHFLGELRNVSKLMQAADLLVLNSLQEPFGLVLIEAMSSGTPVLATRVGGIPEIVKDRINGWLVEKADTAGLATKLVELSQSKDLLEEAGRQARLVTCPQFSLERFHKKLNRFYAEIMPQQQRAARHAEPISPYL
jgi:glycosyltransferase involved in cell wall biosynthesis